MALETLIQGRIISIPTLDEDVKLQVSYSTHALVSCLASCVWRAYLLVRRRSWRSTKPTPQYINSENANRGRFGSAARNSRAEFLHSEGRSETERNCIYACFSRAHRSSSVHICLFHRKVILRSPRSFPDAKSAWSANGRRKPTWIIFARTNFKPRLSGTNTASLSLYLPHL